MKKYDTGRLIKRCARSFRHARSTHLLPPFLVGRQRRWRDCDNIHVRISQEMLSMSSTGLNVFRNFFNILWLTCRGCSTDIGPTLHFKVNYLSKFYHVSNGSRGFSFEVSPLSKYTSYISMATESCD